MSAEVVDLGMARCLAALDALSDILLTDPGAWDDGQLMELARIHGLVEVLGAEWLGLLPRDDLEQLIAAHMLVCRACLQASLA